MRGPVVVFGLFGYEISARALDEALEEGVFPTLGGLIDLLSWRDVGSRGLRVAGNGAMVTAVVSLAVTIEVVPQQRRSRRAR